MNIDDINDKIIWLTCSDCGEIAGEQFADLDFHREVLCDARIA